jgi:prephenate dehydratase/chorismate mutase/prephenate dehydratase
VSDPSPRVGFQGERGAYSEQAVLDRHPDATPVPFEHLADVFEAVARGEVARGIVPIENSQAGSINRTYDLVRQQDLFLTGEVVVPVDHCLVAPGGVAIGDIERVRSHPQALEQCARFLDEQGFEPVACSDTAGAAREIAEAEPHDEAALASGRAAELYDLEVLAENVQTIRGNWTRFVELSPEPAQRTDALHKTSLVLATEHRPGALYEALGAFAERGVNLLKLESRPSREQPWQYVFYVDLEGHRRDESVREGLADLADTVKFARVLGSYEPAGWD